MMKLLFFIGVAIGVRKPEIAVPRVTPDEPQAETPEPAAQTKKQNQKPAAKADRDRRPRES